MGELKLFTEQIRLCHYKFGVITITGLLSHVLTLKDNLKKNPNFLFEKLIFNRFGSKKDLIKNGYKCIFYTENTTINFCPKFSSAEFDSYLQLFNYKLYPKKYNSKTLIRFINHNLDKIFVKINNN